MKTYGTIARAGGKWKVDAEPHVRLKLKRVIERVHKGAIGSVLIADTMENARELLWFVSRYPMLISVDDRDALMAKAEEHKRLEADVAAILAGDYAPPDVALATPARAYQLLAAELAARTGRLLVGDDVGLGKTATAICALIHANAFPAAVVTMTHLPRQWRDEFEKFAPGIRVFIPVDGKPVPFEAEVIVTNYHKLRTWGEHLVGRLRGVVFDEVQELRHPDSQKYKSAQGIAEGCALKCGLSATPIYNYGGEVFSVMDVLAPGELGDKHEFLTEWCGGSINQQKAMIADPQAFGAFLRERGLMLRRTRADVKRELPDLTRAPHYVDADLKVLEEAEDKAAELALIILERSGSVLEQGQAARELDWRLRQATGIAKAPFVAEFVKLLVESGEKVVLFGWHRAVYDIWAERLKNSGVVFYTGEESINQKAAAKEAFVAGEAKVLVMSLRSGAGLDGLQHACRTVVFGELDWSPAVHEQNEGRVHRDGQPDPVTAYYLVSENGSDPVIADILGLKRRQLDGIRDPYGDPIAKAQTDTERIRKLALSVVESRAGRFSQKQEARVGKIMGEDMPDAERSA